jgi:hypothetical protein
LTNKHINFEVKTNNLWIVRRKFSDFEWLRLILGKLHPGHILPILPKVKVGSKNYEPEFLNKRTKQLNHFLTSVCENEYYKSTAALIVFLCEEDRLAFEARMKEFNQTPGFTTIEELSNFEGKIEIFENQNDDNYFEKMKNGCKAQKKYLERINLSLKKFNRHIKSAALNLASISSDFNSLYRINKKFSGQNEIKNYLKELSPFFYSWKKILQNQNTVIETHIKQFFKQVRLDNDAYLNLILERDELRDKLNNESIKLQQKKEKNWARKSISKWDIDSNVVIEKGKLLADKALAFEHMYHKETICISNLRDQLAYLNKMCFDELKWLNDLHLKRFRANFKEFVNMFYPTLTEVIFFIILEC